MLPQQVRPREACEGGAAFRETGASMVKALINVEPARSTLTHQGFGDELAQKLELGRNTRHPLILECRK